MRWLIITWFLVSSSAHAVSLNDIESVQGRIGQPSFSFFYVGHAYGAHKGKDYWARHRLAYPPAGLLRQIETLKMHDFGVLGGDVVEVCNDQTISAFEEVLVEPIGLPLINSTGNHDRCLPGRYGYPEKVAFRSGVSMFIVLSSPDRDMNPMDQRWIMENIRTASTDDTVKRIFLFTHRPVFLQLNDASETYLKQPNMPINQDPEFILAFNRIFNTLPKSKEVFWFAGDMGVRRSMLYNKLQGNVHFIASGIYERPDDHYLSVHVNPDGVQIDAVVLESGEKINIKEFAAAVARDTGRGRGMDNVAVQLNDMLSRINSATGIQGGEKIDAELIKGDDENVFDVYYRVTDRKLTLRRDNCGVEAGRPFFVQFYPRHESDRTNPKSPWNGFHFSARHIGQDPMLCAAVLNVPTYPLSSIQTGQLDENRQVIWQLKIQLPDENQASSDR